MIADIPESHLDLIDGPFHAVVTTLMPDGQPQSTVVWANRSGEYVLFNTQQQRQKAKNLRRNEKVTLLIVDPENPYRYLEIRGQVDALDEEMAEEHIDQLARLYTDKDQFFGGVAPEEQREQQQRVMIKVLPTRVRAVGS
ncbi:MAG: PPOX class F420-dependent oxidoreductase [Candidatus Promineifilaceae bacterium]|nr:PPOX class F420-dependent oxidoreductase [Candidatus Promineifilaceae bacterium]